MANRISPDGGYDFEAKRLYRERLWGMFQSFAGNRRNLSNAVLMPSLEGIEIDVAKRRGFREDRLHIVDRNPAIVATLKRRFPAINTYGVEVTAAFGRIERMAPGSITCANLDLCGCIGGDMLQDLTEIARSRAWAPNAALAVTVLRGRENREMFDWARIFALVDSTKLSDRITDTDRARIAELLLACSGLTAAPRAPRGPRGPRGPLALVSLRYADSYVSSNGQSMLWAVFYRHPRRTYHRQFQRDMLYRVVLYTAACVKLVMSERTDDPAGVFDVNMGARLSRLVETHPMLKGMYVSCGLWPYLVELGWAEAKAAPSQKTETAAI